MPSSIPHVSSTHNYSYRFHCEKWFDSNQGDKRIERSLRASNRPLETKRAVLYTVTVKTSDVSGASTNANVSLTMYGQNGKDTGSLKLASADGKQCFQRGSEDVFEVKALEVDPLYKIRIGHDNTGGLNAPWHLSYVEILNNASGARCVVCCCLRV